MRFLIALMISWMLESWSSNLTSVQFRQNLLIGSQRFAHAHKRTHHKDAHLNGLAPSSVP